MGGDTQIFRRATGEVDWLIMTYDSSAASAGGGIDYEERLNEYSASLMLSLPTSSESFRYALGTYYSRLSGPLQALHKLLQPAAATGVESLALVDLLSAECHCGTSGGAASTAPTPPGSKSAHSRDCATWRAPTSWRPTRTHRSTRGYCASSSLRLERVREAAHLDHTAPSGSGASDSPAVALSVNRDEQRSVRAQLNP